MARENDEVLEECGLDLSHAAATAAAVFGQVQGVETEHAEGDGWEAAARHAAAMFAEAGESDSLSWKQFSTLLRRAYARGSGGDDDLPEFETLPPRTQVAWEAVARHLANVFNFEPREARRLGHHEATIVDWAFKRLGLPLPKYAPRGTNAPDDD